MNTKVFVHIVALRKSDDGLYLRVELEGFASGPGGDESGAVDIPMDTPTEIMAAAMKEVIAAKLAAQGLEIAPGDVVLFGGPQ